MSGSPDDDYLSPSEIFLVEGFDYQTIVNGSQAHYVGQKWTAVTADWNVSALVAGRFGGQALRVWTTSSGTTATGSASILAGTLRTIGHALRIAQYHSAARKLAVLCKGTAEQVWVQVTPSGALEVRGAAAGLLATASELLTVQTWHTLELECLHHSSAGTVELWLDGVSVASATGVDTTDGSATEIDTVRVSMHGGLSATGERHVIDDVYASERRPGFPGGCRVLTVAPDSDVTIGFTPKTGSDAYAMLPIPYDASNSNRSPVGIALGSDRLGIPDLAPDALAPYAAVEVNAGFARRLAGANEVSAKIYSGATTVLGDSATETGSAVRRAFVRRSVDPDTGLGWLAGGINAMDIGYATTAMASGAQIEVYFAATSILMSAPVPPPLGGEVTQAATLVLGEFEPDLEITQAFTTVLYEPTPDLQITQNPNLVLAEFYADLTITQTVIMVLAPVKPCITRDVQCWRIERRDDTVLGFTTHDQPVVFGGLTYQPCASLQASAISSTVFSGASTGDVQAQGIIDDDAISADDLYAGRYDNARVIVYRVDWLTGEGYPLTRGIVSKTEQEQTQYRMTAMSGGARLEQRPLLDVFAPLCRYEFGDSRCGFDAESLRITSQVDATSIPNVVRSSQRRMFYDSARSEPASVYQNARLTWTSGPNAGLTQEVKDIVNFIVTLWQPAPADIQPGDGYTMIPGCNKTRDDCETRFDNYINFGGFPDLPGTDALGDTPDR